MAIGIGPTICVCGSNGWIRSTRTVGHERQIYRVCKRCGVAWSTIEMRVDDIEDARMALQMVDEIAEEI